MSGTKDSFKHTPILVADENAFNRNIVSEILRGAGFDHLIFARDGAELMQATVDRMPKIVIANSRMPKMSGLEFTRAIRAGHEDVDRALSIIIATNTATGKFLEAARASGVDEMLVRPFTAAAMIARVEAVMIRPRRFIDGMNYIGPCRRRRMLEDYGGPMRRFCDPIEAPGDALWEMEANRELVRLTVERLSELAIDLPPGDRKKLQDIYRATQDVRQLGEDVRDKLLAQAAKSLGRYITAIGAAGQLDPEAVSTHIDAMQQLALLPSTAGKEREKLVSGLEAVVDKRLGRKISANAA